jgi:exodeoxyribonuclease V beta subunit
VLAARLAGAEPAALFSKLRARGDLPQAAFAELAWQGVARRVEPFVATLAPLLATQQTLEIDVQIHTAAGPRRLHGRLTQVTPAHGLLISRVASLRARHLLPAWVRHLALLAAAPAGVAPQSLLIARGDAKKGAPVSVQTLAAVKNPHAELATLISLYEAGLCKPLPLLPECSQALAAAADADAGRLAARKAWEGDRFQRPPRRARRRRGTHCLRRRRTALQRRIPADRAANLHTVTGRTWQPCRQQRGRCMNRLDTAALPLTGLQLIEASAGTGKTHAITTLYLRLLLESDRSVRDLLVVTFTHAATDELRARIRRRLVEAQALLAAPAGLPVLADDALRQVLQRQIDSGHAAAACGKLAQMIAGIDEAGIFTIHSFCQRALRDHAFESGEMFDAELTENQQEIIDAAVADWWRQRFYGDTALAGFAASRARLATPAALGKWLRDVLARDIEFRVPACDLDALKKRAAELRTQWPQQRAAISKAINDNPHLSKKRDKSMDAELVAAIAALDDWAAGNSLAPAAAAEKLGQRGLDGKVTEKRREKGGTAPQFALCDDLDTLFGQLTALEFTLLRGARDDVRRRTDEQKRHANLLAFDDLILRLRAALTAPGGDALAQRIAAQFPAAMIDEFQDTDPAQYDIFSRVYRDRAGTCLLMIGDPKQAIYSFRGADIFAYVRARQETSASQRHTMTTNWRSSQALVDGIDALFARLPEPFLMGADVGWVKVNAAGKSGSPLLLRGEAPTPLQFWVADDDERYNKDTFRDAAAAAVAIRCAELLTAADAGEAQIDGRALAPRDIAILVRSHKEAALVQAALLQRGIGSALASQDSVFATPEAKDLACVLDALLAPGKERALKRALVTPLWGLSASTLADLLANESAWDALLEQVHGWHRLWATRGFMPMFRRWLHTAKIPANLLARPHGERALTNLLHLAELLQQASREHASPDELRQWLARAIAGDSVMPGDAQQLRLESDENLVQVVTMHKSKGLEYPVVFLPFACLGHEYGSTSKREDKPLFHCSASNHQLVLDYVDSASAMDAAAREALAEDMRLLYVALTRAKYLCCVQWGAVPGFSALGLLMLGVPGGKPGGHARTSQGGVRQRPAQQIRCRQPRRWRRRACAHRSAPAVSVRGDATVGRRALPRHIG